MEEIKVFLDTDVVISSLLFSKGASHILINTIKIKKIISKTIKEKLIEVLYRKKINKEKAKVILSKIQIISLSLSKEKLLKKYLQYVFDEEDSHVVAAADASRADFLITYNKRHYIVEKIKNELGIKILRPGEFLQYLRSL